MDFSDPSYDSCTTAMTSSNVVPRPTNEYRANERLLKECDPKMGMCFKHFEFIIFFFFGDYQSKYLSPSNLILIFILVY